MPVIKRRVVCAVVLAAPAWPMQCAAQPAGRKPRIAFLSGGVIDAGVRRDMVEPFSQGLRELGYIEGQSISIDYRWAEGRPERLPALLAELLRLQPDVLVAVGPRPAELALTLRTSDQG